MIKNSKNKRVSKRFLGWGFLILTIIIGTALLFFSSAKFASSEDNQTQAKEIEISSFNPSPSAAGGLVTKVDGLKASYLKNENFEWQSETIKTDFAFDALGASWNKDEPSKIDLYVRFSNNGQKWEDWQKLIVDDADQGNEKSPAAQTTGLEIADLTFSQNAQYYQYKVVFSEKKDDAILKSIKFTYIKPSEDKNFSFLNFLGIQKAQAVNSPRIISRAEWGANPNYMTWPPEYVRPNKIIIHHTASGNNPPDPAAVVRAIYYYHAVSLGWGDIGYNYLFDQYGNIYEGRAGGNGSVGAHAYGQNYGSIGFSAIGDFSGVNIADGTFSALTNLVAFEAYQNDFDITWGTIFGHRDFCNNPPGHNCTACPGDVLYSRKGEIIDVARQKEDTYLQRDRDFLNQNDNILVKSYSQPEVYLLKDGQKRHIIDLKTFYLLGYSSNAINYVSSLALNEKPSGPPLSAFVKTADSTNVYLLTGNPRIRYWITSADLFNDYSFSWSSVVEIESEEMNAINYAGPLNSIIKAVNTNPIYAISSGQKRHFADMLAFTGWGLNTGEVISLPSGFVDLYPQGAELYNLVKGSLSDVYLLQSGAKHKIPTPAIFNAWGFKWSEISQISSGQLSSFPEQQNLSRIAKGSGETVYLIDNNQKNYFPNSTVLGQWGETLEDVFLTDDLILAKLNIGFEVTDLAKANDKSEVYLIFAGKKYHLADPQTFVSWNKNWSDIRTYSKDLMDEISFSGTLTRFVKKQAIPEETEIYLVSAGQKRHLLTYQVFQLWGGENNKIAYLPANLLEAISSGDDLGSVIKGSGSAIYLLDKGRKDHITSVDAFNAWGLSFDDVFQVNDQEINILPTGPEIGFLLKASGFDPVYAVGAGKKAHIPTLNLFYAWGFNFNDVATVSTDLADILPNDSPLSLIAKSSADSQNIYLVNQTDKKQFNDNSILEAWSNNSLPSISPLINNLPTNGNPTQLAKGSGTEIFFIISGKKYHLVDIATFNAWGFSINQVTSLSQFTINAIPFGSEMSRLAKGSGPEIYLMDSGQKRHIPSVEVFNSYGWDWNSIIVLPDSFLNQFANGPDVPPNAPSLNITANGPFTIINSLGQTLGSGNSGERFSASYFNGTYFLLNSINAVVWSGNASIKFVPNSPDVIMEILSYYDPNWNGSANYNRFRGSIEVAHSDTGTWAVNDLSLNDYTAGICESPGGHPEYLKTMAVAARSYGLWHLSRGGKHGAEPFHLKNSRRGNGNDQVYCGYGFEAIASSYAPQARATDNQAVLYDGNPALTAYSHGSYPRTRSALEVWGTNYPYLQSVSDPYGDPARPCGTGGNHCVGLSASGAIGFAERGSPYYDILQYYYGGAYVRAIANQNIKIAIYSF